MRTRRSLTVLLSVAILSSATIPAQAMAQSDNALAAAPTQGDSTESDSHSPTESMPLQEVGVVSIDDMVAELAPLPDPGPLWNAGEEIPTARTLASTTEATADDQVFRTTLFTGDINYEADDGSLHPIDFGWTGDLAAGELRASVGSASARVAAVLEPGAPLVRITTQDGSVVEYGMTGTDVSPGILDVTDTLTYSALLDGLDLQLHARGHGIKSDLILHDTDAARASYDFFLRVVGLAPVAASDGSIDLVGSDGVPELNIPAPWMEDAVGAWTPAAHWSLEGSEGSYVLRLVPDQAWLDASERVYPVIIDPTVNSTHSFNYDTYTASNRTRHYPVATYWQTGDHTLRADAAAFFKFGSSVGDTWVPLSGQHFVSKAEISVLNTASWGDNTTTAQDCSDRWVYVKSISQGQVWWTDTDGIGSFAWADRPTWDDPAYGYSFKSYGCVTDQRIVYGDGDFVGPQGGNQYYDNKLDDYANSLETGAISDYGFTIAGSTNGSAQKQFASFEAASADRPKLTLEWINNAPSTSSPTPSYNADLTTPPTELRVRATDSDQDSPLNVKFRLYNASGSLLGSSSTLSVGEGSYRSWTGVPSGLSDGLYQWTATIDDGVSARVDTNYFRIDTTPPTAPTVQLNLNQSQIDDRTGLCSGWYRSATLPVRWYGSTDNLTGIEGFRYVVDTNATTTVTASGGSHTTGVDYAYVAGSDGQRWFHIAAVDGAGNVSSTTHFALHVDRQTPDAPTITSSSHPWTAGDPVWSANNNILLQLTGSDAGPSGVAGYSGIRVPFANPQIPDLTPEVDASGAFADTIPDGDWWFNAATIDCAGNRSDVTQFRARVDTAPPTAPTIAAAPQALESVVYSEQDTTLTLNSTDAGRGVAWFRYTLTTGSPATPTGGTVLSASNSAAIVQETLPVATGVVYVNVQAADDPGASNWGPASFRRINVDTTRPPTPTVTSSTHSQSTWSNSTTVQFTIGSDDPGGISLYKFAYTSSPTPPGTYAAQTTNTSGYLTGPEGEAWLHVVAINNAGSQSPPASYRTLIDTVKPSGPSNVASDTHVANVPSNSERPVFQWSSASDARSGLAGYSWVVNTEQDAPADDTIDLPAAATSVQTHALADGRDWWFHVRAIDKAGNAGPDQTFGPVWIVDSPLDPYFEILLSQRAAESDGLGAEQFYPMWGFPLGASVSGGVNLANGNTMVQFADHYVPAHGLNIAVDYTWNALDNGNHDGLGTGWRLGITDVTLGTDYSAAGIDPNEPLAFANYLAEDPATGLQRLVGQTIDLTDADGTTHRFVKEIEPDREGRWISPPGVDLVVREITQPFPGAPEGTVEITGYEFYRPDGLRYVVKYVLNGWRLDSVRNGNGDALHYRYANVGTPAMVRVTGVGNNRSVADLDQPPSQFTTGMRQRVEFTYNDAGQLIRADALNGEVAPDGDGNAVNYRRRSTFVYGTGGRLREITTDAGTYLAPATTRTKFAYTNGLLTSVIDARGNQTSLAYHTDGRFNTLTDRELNEWDIHWDNVRSNEVSEKVTLEAPYSGYTNAASGGNKTTYYISDRQRAADAPTISGANIIGIEDQGTNAGPVRTDFEWVGNRLAATIAPDGATTRTTYDHLGNVTSRTTPPVNDPTVLAQATALEALSGPTTTEIDYEYRQKLTGDSCDGQSPLRLDGSNPDADPTCYAYGLPMTLTANAGNTGLARTTTFSYARGRIKTVTQQGAGGTADDRAIVYDYHGPAGEGPLASVSGPRPQDVVRYGSTSDTRHYGYDPSGVPETVIDADNNATTYRVDPFGRVVLSTEPGTGAQWITRYDRRGWVAESEDPDGNAAEIRYDANGNATHTIAPSGRLARTEFDKMDRPTTAIAPGRTAATADEIEASTTWLPDGTLGQTEDELGNTTAYTYWPNGQVKSVSAPSAGTGINLTESYYDESGRVARIVGPQTAVMGARPERTYLYSPAGLVSQSTSTAADGEATVKTIYNALGEVVETVGPRTVGTETQRSRTAYDLFGQAKFSERLIGAGEWARQQFTYDKAGRLLTTTRPFANDYLGGAVAPDPVTITTLYSYDNRGLLATSRNEYSDGNPGGADHRVQYTYDALGRQSERLDYVGANPVTGAVRRTETDYNLDGTPRSQVMAYLPSSQVWASCFDSYDIDNLLLASKTVATTLTAGDPCLDTTPERRVQYAYDQGGRLRTFTESLMAPSGHVETRTQTFTHHDNGVWDDVTVSDGAASLNMDYQLGAGGFVASVNDWAGHHVDFTRRPDGSISTVDMVDDGGSSDALGELLYKSNGQLEQITWSRSIGMVRRHVALAYDLGGLRTGETVQIVDAGGVTRPTGGAASDRAEFSYDVAGRLSGWTSPFPIANSEAASAKAVQSYLLDDAGNVVDQTTVTATEPTIDRVSRRPATGSGLSTHIPRPGVTVVANTSTASPGGSNRQDSTATSTFDGTGFEVRREIRDGDGVLQETTLNVPGPGGFISTTNVDGPMSTDDAVVAYLYDPASERLIRRIETRPGKPDAVRMYFTWADGAMAEETDGNGDTLRRWLPGPTGSNLAEQVYRVAANGSVRASATNDWLWLLTDTDGNIATQLRDDRTVISTTPYSPYGTPGGGGESSSPQVSTTRPASLLGYQGAQVDGATGNLLLGPRHYDPTALRFTSADYFAAGGAQFAMSVDSMTGGNYIFAASNPVAFYENGHFWSWNDVKAVGSDLGKSTVNAFQRVGDGALWAGSLGHRDPGRLLFPEMQNDVADRLAMGAGAAGSVVVAGVAAARTASAVRDGWSAIEWLAATGPTSVAPTSGAVGGGIYQFTSSNGQTYVGQSGNVVRRLFEHLGDKLTPEALTSIRTWAVPGGKAAREVAEQARIRELGGITGLRNAVNPVGPARRFLMQGIEKLKDIIG